ncbi:MAG: hypothetical protein ABR978_03710 [Dehalococcoidia bacterium]|jgi:hypothetical protein
MTEADFVSKVREKLQDIGIKERDLQSQLGQLEQERAQYEAALSVWSKEMDNGSKPAVSTRSEIIGNDELQSLTIAKAAELVMDRFGGRAKVTDLTRMLRTAGTTTAKGTGAYSAVLKTLQRNPAMFYEIETGKWGLVRMRPPAAASAPSDIGSQYQQPLVGR